MNPDLRQILSTKLITIPETASVAQARERMEEKRIRHLPVLDSQNEIVGIVSLRDLLGSPLPTFESVAAVMHSPVQAVRDETPIRTVILHMLEAKISSLLVTDEQNEVLGIVTKDDLLWHLAHLLHPDQHSKPIRHLFDLRTIGAVVDEIAAMGI